MKERLYYEVKDFGVFPEEVGTPSIFGRLLSDLNMKVDCLGEGIGQIESSCGRLASFGEPPHPDKGTIVAKEDDSVTGMLSGILRRMELAEQKVRHIVEHLDRLV